MVLSRVALRRCTGVTSFDGVCVYRGADSRMADEGECKAEDINKKMGYFQGTPSLFLFNHFQNLLAMSLGLYFLRREHLFYDAFFVQQESGSECAHVLLSAHALFSPNAHGFHRFFVRICNEGERQLMLVDELLMRC